MRVLALSYPPFEIKEVAGINARAIQNVKDGFFFFFWVSLIDCQQYFSDYICLQGYSFVFSDTTADPKGIKNHGQPAQDEESLLPIPFVLSKGTNSLAD